MRASKANKPAKNKFFMASVQFGLSGCSYCGGRAGSKIVPVLLSPAVGLGLQVIFVS
jgi:hypothetical protein